MLISVYTGGRAEAMLIQALEFPVIGRGGSSNKGVK